jgi:hypothetical protein
MSVLDFISQEDFQIDLCGACLISTSTRFIRVLCCLFWILMLEWRVRRDVAVFGPLLAVGTELGCLF